MTSTPGTEITSIRTGLKALPRTLAVSITACLVVLASVAWVHAASADSVQLGTILERLASTAITYRNYALKFSCTEKMSWTPHRKRGSVLFNYVFVFENGFGFIDYRTPPGESSPKKLPSETSPERYEVPAYLSSPYLWIFSFRSERQSRHRYQLQGEEECDGRPAVVIHFEPIPPIVGGINDWYGTAWVDQEPAQLLKVEAYSQLDWATLEKMNQQLTQNNLSAARYDIQRITTSFSFMKNGMRFPSKVELRNERHHLAPRDDRVTKSTRTLLEVDQEYTNYEFFGIEASEGLVTPK